MPPQRIVMSPDATPIAVFEIEAPARSVSAAAPDPQPPDPVASLPRRPPPLLLVHGTTADHTTFRVVGPELARRRAVFAMDRRGRGASGDGSPYSIELEYDDVASVAAALAADARLPAIDVLGHSYGGR